MPRVRRDGVLARYMGDTGSEELLLFEALRHLTPNGCDGGPIAVTQGGLE